VLACFPGGEKKRKGENKKRKTPPDRQGKGKAPIKKMSPRRKGKGSVPRKLDTCAFYPTFDKKKEVF